MSLTWRRIKCALLWHTFDNSIDYNTGYRTIACRRCDYSVTYDLTPR